MKYSSIIFDLDGTLIDSFPGIYEALSDACESVDGTVFTEDSLQVGPPVVGMLKQVALHYSDDMVKKAVDIFRRAYDGELWKKYNVYPGAQDILEQLVDSKRFLFLATNKPQAPTLEILNDLGWMSFFSDVTCFDKNKYKDKTHLVSKIDLSGAKALLVGDTESDELAATKNGIDFCFCSYGYGKNQNYPLVINTLPELIERV